MKRIALLLALAACGDDGGAPCKGIDCNWTDASIDAYVAVDPLPGIGTVELIQDGFQFTEGPQWSEATNLLFSDIPANTIYTYNGSTVTTFRMPSGNANGLAVDDMNHVIAAQHGTRSVTRDGSDIASTFEGKQLNSPNDVIVARDGTIYFTDPPYGLTGAGALDFMGVFRLSSDGTLTAEHRGALTERPNGIGLSPDQATLYVAETDTGVLWSYARAIDGSLGPRVKLAVTSGGADGLAIDTFGNIFVATTAGIEVFSPSGTRWGTISVPMQPANCAFGDVDYKTLYITARTALYRVRLANAGLPNN